MSKVVAGEAPKGKLIAASILPPLKLDGGVKASTYRHEPSWVRVPDPRTDLSRKPEDACVNVRTEPTIPSIGPEPAHTVLVIES